jgi:hypothetical protein
MASKRIDELDARVVADADLLPVTPSGGPSGKATVAAIVAEGLSQPNSASAGAGASLSIIAADGVTSGAGGSIILEPGAQATTGGNGTVVIRQPGGTAGTNEGQIYHDGTRLLLGSKSGLTRILAHSSASNGTPIFEVRSRLGDRNSMQLTDNGSSYIINFQTGYDTGSFVATCGILSNDQNEWRNISTMHVKWAPGSFSTTPDVGMIRGNIGVLRISNGSTGGGSLAYTSSTPAAIVANQNDYVLTGSAFQRLNCTTAADITGIAPPTSGAHVDGRMIRLVNVGTATVRLMHNDTGSAAANRMYRHNSTNVSLTVNEWADLVYDSTDNGSGAAGWRVVTYA